jgi:hypothetical protein
MSQGQPRVEFDGLTVASDRLVQLVLVLQGEAEVEVGEGIFRVEFDGFARAGDGLFQLLLGVQGIAEIVVGAGQFGVECDGFLVAGDSFVEILLGEGVAAVLLGLLATCLIDADVPHGGGGRGEKMTAVVVAALVPLADEPQVGFMDQGRGGERLARPVTSHLQSRQPAQLVVDQRQQLLRGGGIALLDGGQDLRDVRHDEERTWPGAILQGANAHSPNGGPGLRSNGEEVALRAC